MSVADPVALPPWMALVGSVFALLLSAIALWTKFSSSERKEGADGLILAQHSEEIKSLKTVTAAHETTLATHSSLFERLEKDTTRITAKTDDTNNMVHQIMGKLSK